MSATITPFSLLLTGLVIFCPACSSAPVARQETAVPAAIDYCNICLTCIKTGESRETTFCMGEQAPMPKLRIFTYKPAEQTAEISFDGVGDGKAVHFNGRLQLISRTGNSYTFKPTGEVAGYEGEASQKFEATPVSLIINLMPEPAI